MLYKLRPGLWVNLRYVKYVRVNKLDEKSLDMLEKGTPYRVEVWVEELIMGVDNVFHIEQYSDEDVANKRCDEIATAVKVAAEVSRR